MVGQRADPEKLGAAPRRSAKGDVELSRCARRLSLVPVFLGSISLVQSPPRPKHRGGRAEAVRLHKPAVAGRCAHSVTCDVD